MLHINNNEPPVNTEDIMNYLYFLILILRWDLHICVNVLEKFVPFTPNLFSTSRYSSHEHSSLAFYAIHFVSIKFCVLDFSPLTLSPTFNDYPGNPKKLTNVGRKFLIGICNDQSGGIALPLLSVWYLFTTSYLRKVTSSYETHAYIWERERENIVSGHHTYERAKG